MIINLSIGVIGEAEVQVLREDFSLRISRDSIEARIQQHVGIVIDLR